MTIPTSLKDDLVDNIGKNVFIFGAKSDDTESMLFGTREVTSFVVEIVDHLLEYSVADHSDHIVIHGSLCKLHTIPAEIPAGVTPYIIVMDEQQVIGGILVLPTDSSAKDIATIVQYLVVGADDCCSIPIDQLYVLYGYEVEMKLTVDEEAADEELLSRCEEVVADTLELYKEAKEISWQQER